MENLKKVKNGSRGDGRAKLRKRLHYWNFKSLLSKIDRVAKLRGVEAIKVNPAYTSVIGALKYVPQFGIDKDIAGAYFIGRRALSLKEEIPENYLKLLSDREYLEYAVFRYEEKEREWRDELRKVHESLKELESLRSEPRSCKEAKGRNPKQGLGKTSQSPWQVLKGVWERVKSRLVPLGAGGTSR